MAAALALGVPLMTYGLIVGDMTVDSGGERLVWLYKPKGLDAGTVIETDEEEQA